MTGTRDRRLTGDSVTTVSVAPIVDGQTNAEDHASARTDVRQRLNQAMEMLARGDRSQFAFIFSELWPLLSRTCTEWLNDADDGEDAAQRALITLMSRSPEYRAGDSCVGWALTLAMWECRTTRRRRQRSRLRPMEEASDYASGEPSPEAVVALRQMTTLARGVFDELSAAEQRLVAEAVLGESGGEGPVPAVVRKRKQRALDRIRELWRRIHGD
jgi:RNA polymerase sigma-70 factor (ECF subfamily)